MGEINQPQYERELDYLYGKYSGKSTLDKKIQNAEEILKKNKELEEEYLKKIFDDENYNRLKAMDIKDMSFADVELYNEIRKKYSNIGKDFSGNEFAQPAGSVPDMGRIKSKIISTCNAIIPLLKSRNVQVAPLPEGSSVQDVLLFINHVRDALKQQNEPSLDGLEIPIGETVDFEKWDNAYQNVLVKSDEPHVIQKHVDCTTMAPGEYCEMLDDGTWRIKKSKSKIPYTKEELLIAQAEINKMLSNGEFIRAKENI